jgi:hypothetical protein
VLLSLALRAKVHARHRERTPAVDVLREAIVRAHDTGQVSMLLSWVLAYGVSVAAELDGWEFAATLGAALTDGPLTALIYWNPELAERQVALEHSRAQLDPDRDDAAHARGAAMSYEQLIEYTLDELDRLRATAPS